jgi:hypothetical protein
VLSGANNAFGLGEYYLKEQYQNTTGQQMTPTALQSAYSQLNEFDPQSYFLGSEYSRRCSDYVVDDQEIKMTVCDMEN